MLNNLLGLSNFNIHSFSCELGKQHVDMKMNGTLTKKTNEEYEPAAGRQHSQMEWVI
jgi:hypothetical protein